MTSPKNKTNQRLKTLTFPSLASLTLVACSGGGGGGELVKPPPPANRAPVAAVDKTLSMDEDATNTALDISAPSDADGDNLTITVTAAPTGGTLTLTDGTEVTVNSTLTVSQLTGLVFTPDANLNDDTTTFGVFTYTVSDGSLTDSSTVTISVTPINDAPDWWGSWNLLSMNTPRRWLISLPPMLTAIPSHTRSPVVPIKPCLPLMPVPGL